MPYPPAVYSNQDDLSRFHLAQQRGGYNSRAEQEKTLRFNSWGLPLDSPLASSLTDDDFLNMVVPYLLVTYAENSILLQFLVLELDHFVNHDVSWIRECLLLHAT